MYDKFYERIFIKIDELMHEKKLFLDYKINIETIAKGVGTNRTYVSRAVCGKYKNFKEYVNGMRVDNLLYDVVTEAINIINTDPEEFARRYGFKTRRSLDRVLYKERGYTFSTIRKKVLCQNFPD